MRQNKGVQFKESCVWIQGLERPVVNLSMLTVQLKIDDSVDHSAFPQDVDFRMEQ